jgi:hypothetical protein
LLTFDDHKLVLLWLQQLWLQQVWLQQLWL